MFARSLLVALAVGGGSTARAEEPAARAVASHGYTQAVELKLGKTRAVLCPQAGGRVLEFSVGGIDAMYFDDAEKNWKPGKPGPITAGRFDYGPELTVGPAPEGVVRRVDRRDHQDQLRETDQPARGRRNSTDPRVPPGRARPITSVCRASRR